MKLRLILAGLLAVSLIFCASAQFMPVPTLISGKISNSAPISGPVCSNPTPPHPAQAAGFTTLAGCWDWTATSGNTMCVNGSCVAVLPMSNWFSCNAGAPQWSFNTFATVGSGSCSEITVGTDPVKGNQVLDMVMKPADGVANQIPLMLVSCKTQATTPCWLFPTTNSFIEVNFRFDKEDQANLHSGNNFVQDFYSFWVNAPSGCTGGVEIDFTEIFSGGNGTTGYGDWCNSSGGIFLPAASPNFSDGNYHTVSNLATSSRTSVATGVCTYVDGTALPIPGAGNNTCQPGVVSGVSFCGSGTNSSINMCSQEGYIILASEANAGGGALSPGNFHVYIAWARVWSCAGWTSSPGGGNPTNSCDVNPPFTTTAP